MFVKSCCFIVLLFVYACAVDPTGNKNDSTTASTNDDQEPKIGDDSSASNDDPENELLADLAQLSLSGLLKLQEDGSITMEELAAELTRRLKDDQDFVAAMTGEQGLPGEPGLPITWLGSYHTDPAEPTINQAYYNKLDGIAYVYDGSAWQVLAMDGEDGDKGDQGQAGSKGDQGIPGLKGDPGTGGGGGTSGGIVITSHPEPSFVCGETYSYQAVAVGGSGSLSYHLIDTHAFGPGVQRLDVGTGLFTYQTWLGEWYCTHGGKYLILVTDSAGHTATQYFTLTPSGDWAQDVPDSSDDTSDDYTAWVDIYDGPNNSYDRTVTFKFEGDANYFRCQLDYNNYEISDDYWNSCDVETDEACAAYWTGCNSPYTQSHLTMGDHNFTVSAYDDYRNLDGSDTWYWTIYSDTSDVSDTSDTSDTYDSSDVSDNTIPNPIPDDTVSSLYLEADAGGLGTVLSVDGSWGIEQLGDGSYVYSDSPGGDYAGNQNSSLTLTTPVALTGAVSYWLNLRISYALEPQYDHLYLEIQSYSPRGGYVSDSSDSLEPSWSSWSALRTFDGVGDWQTVSVDLTSYAGYPVRLRLRLVSDSSQSADGVKVALIAVDRDSDGDGVLDGDDIAPNDAFSCHDDDGDGCDECGFGYLLDTTSDNSLDLDGNGTCANELINTFAGSNITSFSALSDGGYALLGATESFGNGSLDLYLVRTDVDGKEVWSRTFGGSSEEYPIALTLLADGGFALLGSTNSFGNSTQFYLVRTDSDGKEIWSSTFGGYSSDIPQAMVTLSDGGFALLGYTGLGNSSQIYLVRIGSDGKEIWSRTYDSGADSNICNPTLVALSDGGFALLGKTCSIYNASSDIYLVRTTDVDGKAVWSRTFGGSGFESATTLVALPGGGITLLGYTDSFDNSGQIYLIHTDADGQEVWSRTFGGSLGEGAKALALLSDGGYALLGVTESFGNGSLDLYLVRTDVDGKEVWSRTFGGSSEEYPIALTLLADGGFALLGSTNSFGNGNHDLYLVRTDANGTKLWSKTFGGPGSEWPRSLVQNDFGNFAVLVRSSSFGARSLDMFLPKVEDASDGVLLYDTEWADPACGGNCCNCGVGDASPSYCHNPSSTDFTNGDWERGNDDAQDGVCGN